MLDAGDQFLPDAVAVNVDIVLGIGRVGDVPELLVSQAEVMQHGLERVLDIVHQTVELVEHAGVEVLVVDMDAAEHAADGLAGVAEALQLADNLVDALHAYGRSVAQFTLGDFSEILGDLVLDVVGDGLVLDELFIDLLELLGVRLVYGLTHIFEAIVANLAEMHKFGAGLVERKLGGAERTALDILEPEDLLLARRGRDHPCHDLLDHRDEPDEDQGVDDVEQGVERGHAVRKGGHKGLPCLPVSRGEVGDGGVGEAEELHHRAHHLQERVEDAEHPAHAEQVEKHMRPCRPLCRDVRYRSRDVGGDGRSDVLAEDHRGGHFEGDVAICHQHHGDGHGGRRGLEHEGHEGARDHEYEDGTYAVARQVGQEDAHGVVVQQHGRGLAQGAEAQEEEGEAHDELAEIVVVLPLRCDQEIAQEHERHGDGPEAERPSPEREGEDPGRDRGADVGAHDDADGVGKRQESGVDEAHQHERGGR